MKRVVIIEDNQVIQQVLAGWFCDDDFEVLTLTDMKDLYTRLDIFKPDLILTDIMLPDTTGHEMIEIFQGVSYPVIVLSSMDRDDVDFFAGRIGAIGAYCKPVDLEEMFAFIHAYFESAGQNKVLNYEGQG